MVAKKIKGEKIIRPPVIAIMGHIDHGKTTLIDYIRKTNVTEKEAGGITQHMSAYVVNHTGNDGQEKSLTFIDTPGHEAFGGIRKRGATVADIVILVVSAEDGVKPQTLEARDCIKESGLPYIVAITKIDKPNADIDRTKQNLAENGVYVEGYGGDVPCVPLSAKTGDGVSELLEMIILLSELNPVLAESDTLGSGIIIESRLDPKRGVVGVGIIKKGEVRRGMVAATRGAIAPLRLILDFAGNQVKVLTAGNPVEIIGWDNSPVVGSEFRTFIKKEGALIFAALGAEEQIRPDTQNLEEGSIFLPLIVKADTSGSLEAILSEIAKLSRERIRPNIVSSGIGIINENDVKAATAATGTTILGFNIKTDSRGKALAERAEIDIFIYSIIYELIKKVGELLESKEPKIEAEEAVGKAKVLKIFSAIRGKQVIGCRVTEGEFKRGAAIKIVRRESEIGRGKVKELQQSKLPVESVEEGSEFGTMVESKIEITLGDVLEAFVTVTK
ncbi:MAG: translation initiation factor IF-2 [bacterium]